MRIHKLSQLPYWILIVATLSMVMGCDSGPSPASTPPATVDQPIQQVLRIGNNTEPQDLDPHIVTGLPENKLMLALFECLVVRDPVTLKIIPALAESWEISADGLVYTFHIRSDAKWSNSDPLTAQDLLYSWKRLLDPGIASENAYNYYPIVNAEAYNKGEFQDFTRVGITADNNNLIFTLKEPTPLFLEWLSKHTVSPVHQKTIEAHGLISDRGTNWTRAGNMVSNGPFLLEEWIANKVIRVKKNPYYWDRDRIKLDEIHFFPIESMATEEKMFRDGQIDMTLGGNIPPDKIDWYKVNQPDRIFINPTYATYYYILNTTIKPLNDVRVRRALAMSIDRDLIVEKVTKGGQTPAYTINPVIPGGYAPKNFFKYDVAQARQLLTEAGYPNGVGLPSLEILYNTLESHRQIAEVIQQMWKQNLNIETTLTNQEWMVYLDTRKQLAYQIARAGGQADMADPGDFLDSYTSNSGMNDTGWKNPEYDALVNRGKPVTDANERYRIFQEAEAILTDEMPIIPIYYYSKINLRSPRVKNWHENLLDYVSYKDVYLADE